VFAPWLTASDKVWNLPRPSLAHGRPSLYEAGSSPAKTRSRCWVNGAARRLHARDPRRSHGFARCGSVSYRACRRTPATCRAGSACDAQRADAPHIVGFAPCEFRNDEVEQLLPRGQRRAGQCQDVMVQPLGERWDVARQPIRLGLGLSCLFLLDCMRFVWIPLAGAVDPVARFLAP
jgi:hypothetical protein